MISLVFFYKGGFHFEYNPVINYQSKLDKPFNINYQNDKPIVIEYNSSNKQKLKVPAHDEDLEINRKLRKKPLKIKRHVPAQEIEVK